MTGLPWWFSKTLPSNAQGTGLIPDQGAKIPHALWPKKLKNKTEIKKKNRHNIENSIKTLKMVHTKKIFKKRGGEELLSWWSRC